MKHVNRKLEIHYHILPWFLLSLYKLSSIIDCHGFLIKYFVIKVLVFYLYFIGEIEQVYILCFPENVSHKYSFKCTII